MNYTDTNKIRKILLDNGLKESESLAKSDWVILNTCSVRQRAEDKAAGLGRRLIDLKKHRPQLKVIMTGCMSQRLNRSFNTVQTGYLEHIKRQFDWVDYFIPVGDICRVAEIVIGKKMEVDYVSADQLSEDNIIRCVPISIGCDNFCSYCIVPYTRGREESIEFNIIKDNVKGIIDTGAKIIVLVGQNVNSWKGEIRGKKACFPELLELVSKISDNIWLSFLTSHPKDFGESLVKVMKERKNISEYLNLPVQSGSDSVLFRMNRKYTRSEYLNKIDILRKAIPEIRLSTDIIVGFPGESDDDFDKTVDLVKKAKFSMAYISEYSPRKGTSGYMLNDDVSSRVKKQRKEILTEIVMSQALEFNRKYINKDIDVLVTGDSIGKTKDLTDVILDLSNRVEVGSTIKVRINEASECGLKGLIIV